VTTTTTITTRRRVTPTRPRPADRLTVIAGQLAPHRLLAPLDDNELIESTLDHWSGTPESRKLAALAMRQFASWLADNDRGPITSAVGVDVRDWLSHRATTVAASTVVKNWSQLRAFYSTAAADTITRPLAGPDPTARVPMPRAPKFVPTHAATDDEVQALCRAIDARTGVGLRDLAMVMVMYGSGLRVGELAQISVADLNLADRHIWLGLTKNDEPRRAPLNPDTINILRRYLKVRGDGPGPLFLNVGVRRLGAHLTTTATQNVVKKAARRAGVPGITPHTLRRGFAVNYMLGGGSETSLMIICGWSKTTMIHRYLADQRATVAQADFDRVYERRNTVQRLRQRVR
jgi:integrase